MKDFSVQLNKHNEAIRAKIDKINEKAKKYTYKGVSSPSPADDTPALASENPAPPSGNIRLNKLLKKFRRENKYLTIKTNWSLKKVRDEAKKSLRRASPLASVGQEIRKARRRLLSLKRTVPTLRPHSPKRRVVASPIGRLAKGLRRQSSDSSPPKGASAKKGAASIANAKPEEAQEASFAGPPFGTE